MMWVLFCVIAGAIGLMLYSSIESEIPDILKLSGKSSKTSLVTDASKTSKTYGFSPIVSSSRMWQARGDGSNVELIRDFDGAVEQGGQRYDAPTMILTCFKGELFVGVDLHMAPATTGTTTTVKVGQTSQTWGVGEGFRLYSPNPRQILQNVRAETAIELTLPYRDLGPQRVSFKAYDGKKALAYLPPNCLN